MVKRPILNSVRHYLDRVRRTGVPVDFGVVYGSCARGEEGEWSDIDLLVVSPQYDRRLTRKDVDNLWHCTVGEDSRIEPWPCGAATWKNDDSDMIVEMARREGVRVDVD